MVRHQTVEEVNIVLAQGAEVEELVDGGALQTELGETAGLLGLVALGARGSEAVGAQVLADVGGVGSVIVGISYDSLVLCICVGEWASGRRAPTRDIRRSGRVIHKRGRMDRPALCGRESSHCVRRTQLRSGGRMV